MVKEWWERGWSRVEREKNAAKDNETEGTRTSARWWHGEKRAVPLSGARPKTCHFDFPRVSLRQSVPNDDIVKVKE